MSTLERLFNTMNLHIEVNKTITKFKDGIKSTIQCNNKPIKTELSAIEHFVPSDNNNIIFSTQSKTKDCSYLFLEEQIHDTLSSKINFIVSTLLELAHNPELYNQIKSQELKQLLLKFIKDDIIDFNAIGEDSLLSKWVKINEKISEKSLQDGLISLTHKIDDAYVEDVQKIEYYKDYHRIPDDERYTFVLFESYISVEFPIYNKLKEAKPKLLGVEINKNEIEVIKAIYQYIFKNIDKKNAYSLLNNSLLKDKRNKENEKLYLVNRLEDITTPTLLLIETFNSLASHIDYILDDIADIDKTLGIADKFNLNLTKDEINELKSYNEFIPNYNSGSVNNFKKELESNPRINFEEFNKQQNEISIKLNNNVTVSQPKKVKKQTYERLNHSLMSFSLPVVPKSMTSFKTILDSEDESFEKVIPNEERKRNTHVIANSGGGKSTMLKTFISKDIKEGNTVIVMDPDGDFAEEVAYMVDNPAKLVFIDAYAKKGKTPTINPLHVIHNNDENVISSMTQEIVVAFENGIGLEWSVNMEAVLYPCISTLIREGGYDISTLQRFMNNEYNQDLVNLGKRSPIKAHREFFQKQFHQEKLDVTKDALGTKLQVLLNDPVFANLVTGENTINLDKEINTKGKVIIFKFSIGEMVTTLTLFSRLVMALIQGIIFRRNKLPKDEVPETYLYLDEFQHLISPSIETMLTQSRKRKCYTTLAHQTITGQLSKKIQDIVSSCTHYKLAGQNSYENHKIMSKALQVKIDVLQNLENGCFISKVGANPSIEIKYSDKFIGKNASAITDKKWHENLEYQIEKYYRLIEDELSDNDSISTKNVLEPKHEDF